VIGLFSHDPLCRVPSRLPDHGATALKLGGKVVPLLGSSSRVLLEAGTTIVYDANPALRDSSDVSGATAFVLA